MVHAFALPGLQAEFAAECQQTACGGLCTSRPALFPGLLESPILLGSFFLLLPRQSCSPVLLLPPEACVAHAGHMLEVQACHSKAWVFFFSFLFPSLLSSPTSPVNPDLHNQTHLSPPAAGVEQELLFFHMAAAP